MKRYFNQNVEDATRIAIVEAGTEEGFSGFNRSNEINESGLPTDFATWKRYTAFSHGDNSVHVMSRNGD